MSDIKQSNIFGDNQVNSSKLKTLAKNHRLQGFILGITTSVIGSFIYSFLGG